MEKAYDCYGNVQGYVKKNKIYNKDHCHIGYFEDCVIYDKCCNPLAFLSCGVVYLMDGTAIGYYDDDFNLYSTDGNYLGYGNFGWSGLLGAVLVLGLLGGGFGFGYGYGFGRGLSYGFGGWGWW